MVFDVGVVARPDLPIRLPKKSATTVVMRAYLWFVPCYLILLSNIDKFKVTGMSIFHLTAKRLEIGDVIR